MRLLDYGQAARFSTIPLVILLDIVGVGFAGYLLLISSNLYTAAIAMIFILLTVIATFFNTLAAFSYYDSYFYEKKFKEIEACMKPMQRYPTVAIAVPTYNEDPKMVERTIGKLMGMEYPRDRFKIYLLDDSTNEGIAAELREFSQQKGIAYVHRNDREGFKAGALNNMLKSSMEEFVAIFDADEYLVNRKFLLNLIPFFEDKKVGYVQTEKRYAKSNFFANSIDLFNGFFFSFVQTSRATHNTSTFAGSCGIVRRRALDDIDGFPEYIIEDTFLSFKQKIKKYKSVYIPRVYALGRPISKFSIFAKQQWRYNYGGTQFLGFYLKNRNKRHFKLTEHVDYISLGFGLNYLSIVLLLFTVLSILIVFADFPFNSYSLSMLNQVYIKSYLEIFGIMALLLSFIAPILVSRIYFGSFSYGVMIFLLNFALTFIRTRAAIAATLHFSPMKGWAKGESQRLRRILAAFRNSMAEVVFSVVLFVLSIFAFMANNLSGGVWLVWYSLLYSSTFYFFYRYR